MKNFLLFAALIFGSTLVAQNEAGVWRGGIDIEVVASGTSTGVISYYEGATGNTPGLPNLSTANFGTLRPGDMVTVSNPYLFSFKNGACDVTGGSVTVSAAPASLPTFGFTIGTFPLSFQANCGDSNWPNGISGCGTNDQEWGDPTATLTFDPAQELVDQGIVFTNIIVTVEWSINLAGSPCSGNPAQLSADVPLTTGVPLPVELVSFEATPALHGGAQLDWVTASESNNAGFYVERSADATQWEDITFVAAQRVESGDFSYAFHDRTVGEGTYYYRLRQTDHDGTTEHSEVRSVDVQTAALSVLASPNPADEVLNLSNVTDEATPVALYDNTGRRVLLAQLAAGEQRWLDVSQLAAGRYTLVGMGEAQALIIR